MPMIAFSVVVFPTPFRPSSVTTSPCRTSKSTPCRMCDSPYHACSPRIASSGPGAAASRMPAPHISLDHVGIARDRPVIAFRKDLAALKHRDALEEFRDHREIVLD